MCDRGGHPVTGSIPPELALLSALDWLKLHENRLTGGFWFHLRWGFCFRPRRAGSRETKSFLGDHLPRTAGETAMMDELQCHSPRNVGGRYPAPKYVALVQRKMYSLSQYSDSTVAPPKMHSCATSRIKMYGTRTSFGSYLTVCMMSNYRAWPRPWASDISPIGLLGTLHERLSDVNTTSPMCRR